MSEMRIGEWFQTATGRQFWPLDPRPEDVSIEDVAHHLANQCRFSGACRDFYSVAQHSVIVSRAVPSEDRRWGLLHDAAEAYLQDMIRPIKRASLLGEEYRRIEATLTRAICERFGLDHEEPSSVEVADARALLAEKRDLLGPAPAPWRKAQQASFCAPDGEAVPLLPLPESVVPWSPREAHVRFLQRYHEIFEGRPLADWEAVAVVDRTRPRRRTP